MHNYTTLDSSRIWDTPYDGQIRLQGGNYSNQGLVEVYCNGEWGTICGDFGSTEAAIVCRQLGYNAVYASGHLSMLERGTEREREREPERNLCVCVCEHCGNRNM